MGGMTPLGSFFAGFAIVCLAVLFMVAAGLLVAKVEVSFPQLPWLALGGVTAAIVVLAAIMAFLPAR